MTMSTCLPSVRLFNAMVAKCEAEDKEVARLRPFVFHLLPGAQEVTRRFAGYVVDLPAPDGSQTLFSRAFSRSIRALDGLGVCPWTTANQVGGFPVFLAALLADAPALAQLCVTFADGTHWSPSDGPFLPHHLKPGRDVKFHLPSPPQPRSLIVSVNLLTHLIECSDLSRIGNKWPSLLSPVPEHAR